MDFIIIGGLTCSKLGRMEGKSKRELSTEVERGFLKFARGASLVTYAVRM